MKIIIAGGTGFIGGAIVEALLAQGHDVVILSRHALQDGLPHRPKLITISWDGGSLGAWCSVLAGADVIINFSGENISARRWTEHYKEILRDSRIGPTRLLVKAIAACVNPPRVLINASAVGYYGNAGDHELPETAFRGCGFLADLCYDWEEAARKAQEYGVRVVTLRMGIVLGQGGVLDKFIPPFRFYLGGPLGSGRQWMSWIYIKDLVKIVLFVIQDKDLQGPVNAVSPYPLTMNDFCSTLGLLMSRPSWLRSPAFILRLVLGEMAEVVLSSQRVVPQKLLNAGFHFQDPLVKPVLRKIINPH